MALHFCIACCSLSWSFARRMQSTTSLVLGGRVDTSKTKNSDILLPFPSTIPLGYKTSFLRKKKQQLSQRTMLKRNYSTQLILSLE